MGTKDPGIALLGQALVLCMGMAFPEDQAVLPSAFRFQWPPAFISKHLFLCSQIIAANQFSLLFQPFQWLRIV